MNIQPWCLLAFCSLVYAPLSSAAASNVVEDLKSCARMVERDARVECYESLGKQVLGNEATAQGATVAEPVAQPASSAPAATAAAVSSVAEVPADKPEMDDHIGGYKFEEKPSDHPDNAIQARVVLCQQDRDKAWFFKFENGQVWKQVDRTTLNFQGCDFPVTILKDGFGYKMKIEGSERQIRISRQK